MKGGIAYPVAQTLWITVTHSRSPGWMISGLARFSAPVATFMELITPIWKPVSSKLCTSSPWIPYLVIVYSPGLNHFSIIWFKILWASQYHMKMPSVWYKHADPSQDWNTILKMVCPHRQCRPSSTCRTKLQYLDIDYILLDLHASQSYSKRWSMGNLVSLFLWGFKDSQSRVSFTPVFQCMDSPRILLEQAHKLPNIFIWST